MKSINEMLDEIKTVHKLPSDYKLAQYLNLSQGAIAHYRHGRSMPDEIACQKIANALSIDGDVLAAQVFALRAKSTESQAFWNRIAARLAGAGAATAASVFGLVAIVSMLVGTPTPAQAGTGSDNANNRALYIMYS